MESKSNTITTSNIELVIADGETYSPERMAAAIVRPNTHHLNAYVESRHVNRAALLMSRLARKGKIYAVNADEYTVIKRKKVAKNKEETGFPVS